MKTLLAVALAALVSPALAKDTLTNGCGPFAVALRLAMDQFGEAPAFIAIRGTSVITITVNARTGSFTVWAQKTPDIMCAVDAGEGWQVAPDSVKAVAPAGKPS